MNILICFFSFVHRLGCQIKNLLYQGKIYKPKKAPLPVISVGNIVFGGSEKTPLAMNLISFLLKEGFKPALISRGYKGRWERKGGILSDGKKIYGSWSESGDEPFMVAQEAPEAGVFIGKNRLLSCHKAKDLGFDLAILDDGFQHRRLHRDLDIVLFDPREKITLREFSNSLKRAHVILIRKGARIQDNNKLKTIISKPSLFEYSVINKGFCSLKEEEILSACAFQGKRALVFCGIARPERFLTFLKDVGIEIVFSITFPDHHPYPQSSLKKIINQFHRLQPDLAITTEKDALKIRSSDVILKDIPLYYVKIDLDIEEKFYEKILSILHK